VSLPGDPVELEGALERVFQEVDDDETLMPAVVLEASPAAVKAVLADGETVQVTGEGLKFAARSLGDKAIPTTRIRPGA
jgi:penicillin-binding protein 1A